jgi:hypothetical protein
MITIYHLETSRSERIVWLMEELGLEYELKVFPREATGAAPPPLKAIHPLGKAPLIRDGDTLLAESARSSTISSTAMRAAALPCDPKHRRTPATSTGCTSQKEA